MSALRGPERVRRTGGPIADVRTALLVAVVDTATIGCWFALVVLESRTHFTALAGLSVLCFGAMLRTGFVASSFGHQGETTGPGWLLVSGIYAAIWIGWLLTAELIGGQIGIALAGGMLVVSLSAHFSLANVLARPRSTFFSRPRSINWTITVGPAVVLAGGATALLGLVWYIDPTMYTTTLIVGTRTIVLEIHTVVHGVAALGCSSFLGTHRLLSIRTAW